MSPVAHCKVDRNKIAAGLALPLALVAIALLCASPRLAAQGPPRHFAGDAEVALDSVLRDEDVQAALLHVNEHRKEMTETLVKLASVEAPSGKERARASLVAQRMREIGLKNVVLDAGPNPNVVGRIEGRSRGAILFVSTLDDLANVAELQRRAARHPYVEGEKVMGPGTNTSATTASMLAAAAALASSGVKPAHDLIFAAVAEEETGLKGMKRLYTAQRDSIAAVVDVLGDGRSITYGAIGIDWWRIMARGPGGHTLNGGLPNVNHGIARAVDGLFAIHLPPKEDSTHTVLNVAMISSGDVFNHKPDSGWFSLDVRSLDAKILASTEDSVGAVLDRVTRETGISFEMQEVQRTPGGQIAGAAKSPLVTTSVAIAKWLGMAPVLGNAGSANMNVSIAGGTPSIGLGGERGGQRGYPDEWADIPSMTRSAKHIVLLAATLQ